MAIYAIADLHLSFDERVNKPMDIYGERWINHTEKIKKDWLLKVKEEDTVIVAGDISWALKLDEALKDLAWINELPGQKVMIKGNHELWWSGINKLNRLHERMYFLQNTCFEAEGTAICGSRGWICPGSDAFTEDDEKIYTRELIRLEMSLSEAEKKGYKGNIIGVLHYPPTNEKQQSSGFTKLFEKYGVKSVVYGHLHGKEIWKRGIKGIFNGVKYDLVAQDYTDGKLILIKE